MPRRSVVRCRRRCRWSSFLPTWLGMGPGRVGITVVWGSGWGAGLEQGLGRRASRRVARSSLGRVRAAKRGEIAPHGRGAPRGPPGEGLGEGRGEGRGARGGSKGEGRGILPHPLSRRRTEESHATLSLSTCTSTSGPCSRLNRCTDTVTARTWTSCVHVRAHVQVLSLKDTPYELNRASSGQP